MTPERLRHLLEGIAYVLLFVAMAVYFLRYFFGKHHRMAEEEALGGLKGCYVGVARGEDGRRMVGFTICISDETTLYAYLTSTQARLLAEWLRLAAAPGKTLAEARRALRRSKNRTGLPPTRQ